jgi:hypothetical protein
MAQFGAIEFPYIAVPYCGPGTVPGVPIRFVRPDGVLSEQTNALIDSGSDGTCFPLQWWTRLGIDPARCVVVPSVTAAGRDDLEDPTLLPREYLPGVTAELLSRRIHLRATFRPNLEHPILLGRDFFEHFRVSIDHRNRRFWLQPYED